MAGLLIVPGIWPVFDANGDPVSGATINFYEPNTVTPKPVYSDATLATSLGTSLTTNAAGEPTTLGGAIARLWWAADGAAFDVQVTFGAVTRSWSNVVVSDSGVASATLEQFGGGTAIASNTNALNLWIAAVLAGTAPRILLLGSGSYNFLTLPNRMEDMGPIQIVGQGLNTGIIKGFSNVDETSALIHALGNTNLILRDAALGTSGTNAGGSLVRLEAKTTAAPDFSEITNVYFTSYSGAPTQVISAATTANPCVFTVVGHGYVTGNNVVLAFGGTSVWSSLAPEYCQVDRIDDDTFRLINIATTNFIDSSTLGAYPANSMTVKLAQCADVNISVDGLLRTAGAQGVRGAKINNCQVFGGRRAAISVKAAVGLDIISTVSGAGWNGKIIIDGTVTVPTYYANIGGSTIDTVQLGYSNYTRIAATVQGNITQTVNTIDTLITGKVGGNITRLGTRNPTIDFVPLGGGIVRQSRLCTGVTGSFATFSFPVAFKSVPRVWVLPHNTGSFGTAIYFTSTPSGVQIAGTSLSAGGDVMLYAEGEL